MVPPSSSSNTSPSWTTFLGSGDGKAWEWRITKPTEALGPNWCPVKTIVVFVVLIFIELVSSMTILNSWVPDSGAIRRWGKGWQRFKRGLDYTIRLCTTLHRICSVDILLHLCRTQLELWTAVEGKALCGLIQDCAIVFATDIATDDIGVLRSLFLGGKSCSGA